MTSRATIQLLVILAGVVFEVMGTGYGNGHPFPISNILGFDHSEWKRAYIYNFFEHIKFISISLLMWLYPPKATDFKTDGLFVILAIVDLTDYLLFGNNVWFTIHLNGIQPVIPISMNTFSIAVFCYYANREFRTNAL